MKLNNTAVKNTRPRNRQYRIADGGGMYLLVKPSGKKYWRLDYSLHGKRKTYAIGTYPTTSLKDARTERDRAKALVADGIDPVLDRQQTKAAQVESAGNTFEGVGKDWFKRHEPKWTPGHARTIRGRLEKNLYPWIGKRPISDITPPEILRCLRRIESRGAIETAHRCRTIVGQVFRYAISAGLADRDMAADLKGALTPVSPAKMAAITDPQEVGALMRSIAGYNGDIITCVALRFSALTFVRPGELRHAEWSEINWIKKLWVIPTTKMKGRREHTVPLSNRVLDILREIYPVTGEGKYVFPSLRSAKRPMSENTVLAALRRMGYAKETMTPHGFRSTASTLLHENGWEHELVEMQLAHVIGNKVSQAYNRAERLEERTKMMQWYADYLYELETGDQKKTEEIVSG